MGNSFSSQPLPSLPGDVLKIIISFIDIRTKLTFAMTSKYWKNYFDSVSMEWQFFILLLELQPLFLGRAKYACRIFLTMDSFLKAKKAIYKDSTGRRFCSDDWQSTRPRMFLSFQCFQIAQPNSQISATGAWSAFAELPKSRGEDCLKLHMELMQHRTLATLNEWRTQREAVCFVMSHR